MLKMKIIVAVLLATTIGIFLYFAAKSLFPNQDEQFKESEESEKIELVVFHNGSGPMCLEALDFFEREDIKYTEYLTTDFDFSEKLFEYQFEYNGKSEGVSANFEYFPMIFVEERAFSGFDEQVAEEILQF